MKFCHYPRMYKSWFIYLHTYFFTFVVYFHFFYAILKNISWLGVTRATLQAQPQPYTGAVRASLMKEAKMSRTNWPRTLIWVDRLNSTQTIERHVLYSHYLWQAWWRIRREINRNLLAWDRIWSYFMENNFVQVSDLHTQEYAR